MNTAYPAAPSSPMVPVIFITNDIVYRCSQTLHIWTLAVSGEYITEMWREGRPQHTLLSSPPQSWCVWHHALSPLHEPPQSASASRHHQNSCTTLPAASCLPGSGWGWTGSVDEQAGVSDHPNIVPTITGPIHSALPGSSYYTWLPNSI